MSLPRRTRSTSENDAFWRAPVVQAWPGRKGDVRSLGRLPAENPDLLIAYPAEADFEACVAETLAMLAAS